MPAQYLLPCPSCDSSIEVTNRQAGQQTKCSDCNAEVDVPRLGTLKTLPTAGEEKSTTRKSRGSGALASVGLLMLAVGAIAGYFTYRYAQDLAPNVDVANATEEFNLNYDGINGVQAWDTFEDFEADELGEWKETNFVRNDIQGGILTYFAYGLFGLGGIGLLLMLISPLIRS